VLNPKDPLVNTVFFGVLVVLAIWAIIVGGFFAVPILLIAGLAKGIHWYSNRPPPTNELLAQTQQRSVAANFPETDDFMEAYVKRFFDAVRDDLPTYQIYRTMAFVTEARPWLPATL